MNSRILNFFNVKLDAFIVFVSVVVVIMFIALFFLLLDYLKMRKRYVEFMTGESGSLWNIQFIKDSGRLIN